MLVISHNISNSLLCIYTPSLLFLVIGLAQLFIASLRIPPSIASCTKYERVNVSEVEVFAIQINQTKEQSGNSVKILHLRG